MKKMKQLSIYFSGTMLSTMTGFLLSFALPAGLSAQNYREANPESATCQVSFTSKGTESSSVTSKGAGKPKEVHKTHKPALNRIGYFNQISNVEPQQKVLIEVAYPNAKAGDKVAIAVADGGTLENNQKASVLQLNSQKKLSFNFFADTDLGIYRIMLRKGNDTKVVQLWVGDDRQPMSK